MKRRSARWIVPLTALIAVVLAVSWMMGSRMTQGSASAVPPAVAPAQDFTILTADGLSIAATFRPGRAEGGPAVLLLHGNGASRAMTAETAQWLAGEGYATLTIDFRGHGQSSPTSRSFGLFESRDAAAAFAWLKARQRGARVAVIGISLGGAASLLGDAGPLPADALVLQAVYADIRRAVRNRLAAVVTPAPAYLLEPLLSFQSKLRFGVWPDRISPLAGLARYRGPVLVIGGGADRYTPPEETRAMFAAAPGPRSLWLVDGLDHAAVSGMHTEAYRQRLKAFLARWIGDPAG
jgi:pimeloyl-ACP methyl ester carboxylesterase